MIKYFFIAFIWITQSTFASTFLESLQAKNQRVEYFLKENQPIAAFSFMQKGRLLLCYGFDEDQNNGRYTRNFRNTGNPRQDAPTKSELAEIFRMYSLSAPSMISYAAERAANHNGDKSLLNNPNFLKSIIDFIFSLHSRSAQEEFHNPNKSLDDSIKTKKQRILSVLMNYDFIFKALFEQYSKNFDATFSWSSFYSFGKQFINQKLAQEDNRADEILREVESVRVLLSSQILKEVKSHLDKRGDKLPGLTIMGTNNDYLFEMGHNRTTPIASDQNKRTLTKNNEDYYFAMALGKTASYFTAEEIRRIESSNNPERDLRELLNSNRFGPNRTNYITAAIKPTLQEKVARDFASGKLSALKLVELGGSHFQEDYFKEESIQTIPNKNATYITAMEAGRNGNRFSADEIESIASSSDPEEELREILAKEKFMGTKQVTVNGEKVQIPHISDYIEAAIKGNLQKDVRRDFDSKKLSALDLLKLGNTPFSAQQYP